MKTKTKNKGGRPSKKDKIDFKAVERMAGLGLTDVEMSYVIGIDEVTLNRWKKDPKFCQSLKKGKLISDQKVIQSLYKRALGYKYDEVTYEKSKGGGLGVGLKKGEKDIEVTSIKHVPTNKTKVVTKEVAPDTTACIFWLKNRRKQDWRDKNGTTIELNDNRKFQHFEFKNKSGDEIVELLTSKLKNRV